MVKVLGIFVKGYVEQFLLLGGVQLVSCYQGLLVDYIEYFDEVGVVVMCDGGIVGVLLFGVFYFLCEMQCLLVELLCCYQVFVVVVSDFNFGISLFCSLYLVMNMVCVQFGLMLEEVWVGVMCYVVCVLGRQVMYGQFRVGYWVDFVVWDVEQLVEIVYELGCNFLYQWVYRG